jgi:tRNA A37 threonylcarbamoyladenosine biosynthesis protein TsaE
MTTPSSTTTVPPAGAVGTPPPGVSQFDWLSEYPPPRSLPLDQEALRIYEHAYAIGLKIEKEDTPPITFSTVIVALLEGQDDTSQWFARLAGENGPNADAVFSDKRIDRVTVQSLVPTPGKPQPVRLSADKHLLTASARALLGNAEGWAQRVGGSDIGVRHLVASYVLNPPPAHRAQMLRWKFQEAKWRSELFAWVATRYTAEQWTEASHRPSPTVAIPAFEQPEIKGAALAFPGDESTLEVLATAAAYHARRTDRWLRLQTVFHALVETARENDAVRTEILPVSDAVDLVEAQYRRAHSEFFSVPVQATTSATFAELDISPRVLNALETARELAIATRTDTNSELRVGVLHLAGALVSCRVDGDEELASMGLLPQALRLALIQHAKKRAESSEVWREALGEEESVQAGRPLDLNSDDPEAVVRLDEAWTSDPLGIRRDVETFAALLASKSLEPPLSIGLFGPWGSGKTTFLRRLRRAVQRRADDARATIAASRPTPFVSNVVHVDFNAWHFAEEALTSSLVDTILRALSAYIKDDKQIAGKAWRQQKLEALETTKRKVEAAKAVERAAQARVSEAETSLTDTQAKAAQAATSLQGVLQGVWSATKQVLQTSRVVKDSGVLDAVGDTIRSTEDLHGRLEALRKRPARLLGDLGWSKSLVFAALVLVVPPLMAWLTNLVTDYQVVQLLSFATATLSVIGVWARAATGAVYKVDTALTEVADAYAKRLAEDAGVITAEKELDAAYGSAATAAAGLQVAREELARARAEAANAALPAQMLQLVSSRIDAQTYNQELTTLSLARADLEALSILLRDQRSDAASVSEAAAAAADAAPEPPARAVDRVILYIDDLDRCKPTDVVRVLQLVHMLLAFELFVVVVAVDARWVEEALMQSYQWLADGREAWADGSSGKEAGVPMPKPGRVSPQDYLEKIFQIAFWLEPMTASRAASYLASLVRTPSREESISELGIFQEVQMGTRDSVPLFIKVEIAGIELDYMRYLAAYVGSSPRRVKRLVNAYRLIKAGLSDSQLRTFLAERAAEDGGLRSGPYQLVIGLLVIGTGAPSSSAQILKELAECDPTEGLEQVVDRLRGRDHPDWTMAAQVIEALMRSQRAKNVSELRGWARKVGRFLLHGSPDIRMGGARA